MVDAATLRRNLDAYIEAYIQRWCEALTPTHERSIFSRPRPPRVPTAEERRDLVNHALVQHTEDVKQLLKKRAKALALYPAGTPAYEAIRAKYDEGLAAIGAGPPEPPAPPPPVDKAAARRESGQRQSEHLQARAIMMEEIEKGKRDALERAVQEGFGPDTDHYKRIRDDFDQRLEDLAER